MIRVPRRLWGSSKRDPCASGICSTGTQHRSLNHTFLLSSGTNSTTHQSIFPAEQLLPLLRLNDPAHTDLPRTALTRRHFGTQRSPHYLMPVADPYDLHPILRQHLFHELNQPYNPRVVIIGIKPYARTPLAIQSSSPNPSPAQPSSIIPIISSRAKARRREPQTYDSP